MMAMDSKSPQKPDNPEQSRRFIELARAARAGADKSAAVLKELAKPAVQPKKG